MTQGKLNAGFYYLMGELPQERLLIAVMGLSSAEAVFELTRKYAGSRLSHHTHTPYSHQSPPSSPPSIIGTTSHTPPPAMVLSLVRVDSPCAAI